MKRTNLMLNEDLLEAATKAFGEKTYSATVNRALEDALRLTRLRGLKNFIGSGVWSGSLSIMREDGKKSR